MAGGQARQGPEQVAWIEGSGGRESWSRLDASATCHRAWPWKMQNVLFYHVKCPKTWSALSTTVRKAVRGWDVCELAVYLVSNQEELDRHAQQGHCVAVPLPLARDAHGGSAPPADEEPRSLGELVFGRPEAPVYRAFKVIRGGRADGPVL